MIKKILVANHGEIAIHIMRACREIGIPCVSGTVEATQKIKTGDKVWLDGNREVVYIMDK
jgi:pyruvate,water dikinase